MFFCSLVLPFFVVDICSKNRDKVHYYNLGVLSISNIREIQIGVSSSRNNLTKSKTMNRQIGEQLADENKLIRISKEKIEILVGEPDLKSNEEWVYTIKKNIALDQLKNALTYSFLKKKKGIITSEYYDAKLLPASVTYEKMRILQIKNRKMIIFFIVDFILR